jgi:hypothetical protein
MHVVDMTELYIKQSFHLANLDLLALQTAVQAGFIAWIDGYGRYTAAPSGTFGTADGLHVIDGQDSVQWGDDTQFLSSPDEDFVSITTTNSVPTTLYSHTISIGGSISVRATIIAIRSSGVVIGKFVREFTAKRIGAGSPAILQDLVPSPDYIEDPNLSVSDSVSGPNIVIIVTGLSGTIDWHAHVEVVS